jgi:hypothetical protein
VHRSSACSTRNHLLLCAASGHVTHLSESERRTNCLPNVIIYTSYLGILCPCTGMLLSLVQKEDDMHGCGVSSQAVDAHQGRVVVVQANKAK